MTLAGIDVKAVVIGALVDTVATAAVVLLLVSAMSAGGIPEEEIMLRMRSISGLLLNLIAGLGCTFLGGYVAGRIALRSGVLQGGIVAGIGILAGLLFRETGLPQWYEITGLVGMLPAGMAGGYCAVPRAGARETGR